MCCCCLCHVDVVSVVFGAHFLVCVHILGQ